MRLRGIYDYVLETFIDFQIYRQFTIAGLNFITIVNYAARRQYSFGHANLCLNPLMISILIRKVFEVKRTMDVHIEGSTITTGRPCTCVLIPLSNICDFEGLKLKENGDTNNYLSLFYKRRRKVMFQSSKHKIIHASLIL